MSNDLATKQGYLYKQIIEGGYNAQQFQAYLSANQTYSDNLQAWPYKQLKKAVSQFKQIQDNKSKYPILPPPPPPPPPPKPLPNNTNIANTTNKTTMPQPTLQKVSSNKNTTQNQVVDNSVVKNQGEVNPTKKSQIMSEIIKCQSSTKNSLVGIQNLQVEITKFEKRQGGIFQKNYVVYLIYIPVFKTTVERRYSDFQWLRDTLKMLHPGLPLPPLAKKGKLRISDEKHSLKRMLILQIFLNRLVMIPDVLTDQVFQSFLRNTQYKDFERIKSIFKKNEELPFINIKKTQGELVLTTDPRINNFLTKTQRHIKIVQPDVKRLYKEFKGTATLLQGLSANLNGVAITCKDLNGKLNLYCKQSEITFNSINLFSILQGSMFKYASLFAEQAKIFRKDLYATLKYQSFLMINYNQWIGQLATLQNNYTEANQMLQKKKDKLYDQGNMAKWNLTQKFINKPSKEEVFHLMLPKQTKQVNLLWQKYALFNNQIYCEILRNHNETNKFISKALQIIVASFSRIASQNMMLWADIELKVQQLTNSSLINVK